MHYGFNSLPLPFSSTRSPDIAAGREETAVRAACRSAVAATAPHITRRDVGQTPVRPRIDPLIQPWFLQPTGTWEARSKTVARAYVRVRATCDGAYAGPTLAALQKWFADSGYSDTELTTNTRSRPNGNALARAAALMEIALYEEIRSEASNDTKPRQLPVPTSPVQAPDVSTSHTSPEIVSHPDLVALLHAEELTTTGLLRAAAAVQDQAVNGKNVAGQIGLLLRVVRPRLDTLAAHDLERIAVSVSYVAATSGDPFLALEWVGHFLDRVGITDRTFTVVVNASEAAAAGGYHDLAASIDRYFHQLRARWDIPAHQIPLVEHTEAEQQRLVAGSYRLEHAALAQFSSGNLPGGRQTMLRSINEALTSSQLAYRVLTDKADFPDRPLPGKASRHGCDLAWPWFLGAVLRATEAAAVLAENVSSQTVDRQTMNDVSQQVALVARFARSALQAYGEPITVARFHRWYAEASALTDKLDEWTPA